ncbi:hypothetical protein D1007_03493 [Hordeum vulgare]|uniref:Uncharacterized protein n=1 Tax=Hordeum vulgare subsp. vulgare TaxID=112509 RepID=A0A8I6WTK8_HORVV|nr:uncharacterized protein LOC123441915 [Hordeum vulgare subsp. vulgare]KAE8818678.1 hypothetical protein D1007_03493 [Hordeum vulgare]KAI5000472.1 hypothetical protein ZWY2020_005061 [Hordeum vulgare]
MSLGRPDRGNAAAGRGGGDDRGAAPLGDLCPRSFAPRDRRAQAGGSHGSGEYGVALPGTLGLGGFPRHDLPAPPDGLDLNDAVAPPVSQVAPAPARSSHACAQELRARVHTVETAFSDADSLLRAIQVEIQQMREEGHEKDRQIRSIVECEEMQRQSRLISITRFDHDKELMCAILQEYRQRLQKSSDAILEYKKMCEGSGVSSSGVRPDEQNRSLKMQQQSYADHINEFQKYMLSRFAGCAEEIRMLATRIADLNNELERLNDYIQIPDLNIGGSQL